MSNAALTWVFPIPVTGPRKAVLIALAEHADDDGDCWPSISRLALFAGVTERCVQTSLKSLEAAGLVRVDRSTGGRNSNQYRLDITGAPDEGLIAAAELPRTTFTPATDTPEEDSPPQDNRLCPEGGSPAPAPHSPLPRTRNTQTLIEPLLTLIEPPEVIATLFPEPDLVNEAVKIWNEVCGPSGGRVQKLTKSRVVSVKARLRDDFGNDLKKWRGYCRLIADNPGLSGANDREWSADFDWAVKPGNMVKVLEGKYRRWGRDSPAERDPTFSPGAL